MLYSRPLHLQDTSDVYVNVLAGDEVIQVNDQIVVSDPSCAHLLQRVGGNGLMRMDEQH